MAVRIRWADLRRAPINPPSSLRGAGVRLASHAGSGGGGGGSIWPASAVAAGAAGAGAGAGDGALVRW